MVIVSDLRARVVSEYQRQNLPSWPDPHPGVASPRDEEYSRVTDPARYQIVHARARAWAAVLEEALDVRSESLDAVPDGGSGPGEVFDRGVRLVPHRRDTLPLLLLERDVPADDGDVPLAVLRISVVRPEVVIAVWSVGRSSCCAVTAGMRSGIRRAAAAVAAQATRTSIA